MKIYEGPLNAAVKRIRLVSLTTLATSLMLPPMALIFKSSATVSLMGKVAVGGTAMVAGVGSTAALHFCTLPFVFEMSREGDRIVATRMDILARRTTFDLRKLTPAHWRGELERARRAPALPAARPRGVG